MNPSNYESFVDPNSGEWIRLKRGEAKDVVWRPTDIQMEDGKFKFDVEFLTGPGIASINERNQDEVARYINSIMTDMIAHEKAQLEMLADAENKKAEQPEDEAEVSVSSHIADNFKGENAHQVSSAMLPQDVQADLAQISSVLGGLKDI